MSNCEFVTKKEIKEYREIMRKIFPKIQKKVKEKYGKSFSYMMVGSAKRNLVVQKGKDSWDIDYQIQLLSPKFDEINAGELKTYISEMFQKYMPEYSSTMSTSVITIHPKHKDKQHPDVSFDIAIIKNNKKTGDKEILRGKKVDENSKDNIKWELLGDSKKLYEKRYKIKGSEKWKIFRNKFRKLKCDNIEKEKDKQIPTFSIYLISIKETLDATTSK